MTKNNPDELCEECKKFDYDINHNGLACLDILIICNHESITDKIVSERKNKRTGTMCCLGFLESNGYNDDHLQDKSIDDLAVKIASIPVTIQEIAEFLKS